MFVEYIRGETVEENVITKPDLTKTGLSGEEGTTDDRPVRRKSEKLRRLLEKEQQTTGLSGENQKSSEGSWRKENMCSGNTRALVRG